MSLDHTVVAALVAGLVSVTVGVISYFSNRSAMRHQVQQTQFKDVLVTRIKLYPQLWRIHIYYETNWVLEEKPKTREWAEQYVAALNEFNLEGGLFFSEDLYRKFYELRDKLYEAIQKTKPNGVVDGSLTATIRSIVYGGKGIPGLSTYEKDDLGSYRSMTLQRRAGES
jgi:hypothetical protein